MAKHRAGDRRIISISIPEDLALKLDRKVGRGRNDGRSATISKLIEQGLNNTPPKPVSSPPKPVNDNGHKGLREEVDSIGIVSVPENAYYGAQTARSLENFNIGRDIMPRS